MLNGIDRKEVKEYSSKEDTGNPKTIFHIANFPQREKIELMGRLSDEQGRISANKILINAVDIFLKGVRKISNFVAPGSSDPVTIDPVTEETVEMIPLDILAEVAGEVVESNFLSEKERKK